MGNNPTKPQAQGHHSGIATNELSSTTRPVITTRRPDRPDAPSENPQVTRRRGSRHDLSIFGLGGNNEPDPTDPMARRETRAEREARKLEKERALREKERERSVREEGVDGGYLVTLGTYTGTEDFSKPVVRQLMIERRLAPFWKGLQDHEDSWTENQLVAAARGLPIPPADEKPPEDTAARAASRASSSPRASDNHLAVPIKNNSPPAPPNGSAPTQSVYGFTAASPPSPFGSPPSSSPFFRGRAKTLAALTTSRNNSQQEMSPQELQLPKDPYVHGQLLEAYIYKDASECPICFLYYPPYLNKTRCCDQPICSECFVQIKRPDPHPPEHHDDPDNPHPPEDSGPADEYHLISEPATCPFCKQPEFGITYDAPPFRRGLTYGDHHRIGSVMSAMSSSSSLNSQGQGSGNSNTRRRTTSLGANSPTVITTDKIRPDWAKKLSDARSHALRRAAAATALHNAAYVLGNNGGENGPRLTFGRRRRTLFGSDAPNGSDGLGFGHVGQLLAAADRQGSASGQSEGQNDLYPGRSSSRRSRIDDLEDLMMMEAIRLSLAAEDERKKREEKEAAKNAKKEEKQKAKDAKKAEKAAKKGGMYSAGMNSSSTSHFTVGESSSSAIGKGKAPDRSGEAQPGGSNSFTEPSSTLNAGGSSSPPRADPQRHLEQSRANIHSPATAESSQPALLSPASAIALQKEQPYHRHALRQLSNASSSASSFQESGADNSSSFEASPNASGLQIDHALMDDVPVSETPPGGGAGTEPMFNFRSLAAVIGDEDKDASGNMVTHIEHATPSAQASPLSSSFPKSSAMATAFSGQGSSSSGGVALRSPTPPSRPLSTGEKLFGASPSSPPVSPTRLVDSGVQISGPEPIEEDNEGGVALAPQASNPYDAKHYGDISVLDSGPFSAGPLDSARQGFR